MSIRDWPAAERPREKLLAQGAATLTDAELLAIFLRTGVAGQSAVDLARHLLGDFGSLRALLQADLSSFSQRLGLGPAKFAQLQAVLEMARRHLAEQLRRDSALESPQAVRDYLKALLRHEPHEVFGCLFLDSKHRVLAFEALFSGGVFSNKLVSRAYWSRRNAQSIRLRQMVNRRARRGRKGQPRPPDHAPKSLHRGHRHSRCRNNH